jgi:hypothetical protein
MTPARKIDYGVYTLKEGESVVDVSQAVYLSQNRVPWLLEANRDVEWAKAGEKVVVPGKTGTLLTASDGDGLTFMFQRDLPGKSLHQYLPNLLKWNGNVKDIDLVEGDEIFVLDRQPSGY